MTTEKGNIDYISSKTDIQKRILPSWYNKNKKVLDKTG